MSVRGSVAPQQRTPPRLQSHPVPQPPLFRRDFTYWAFASQIAILLFAQKFVVPFGSSLPISLPFVTLYAWLAVGIWRSELKVAPVRLGLFLALSAVALVTQLLASDPVSLPSLLQFLLLYFPLIFIMPVPRERYLQLLGAFQDAMIVGCVMVYLQLAWQLAFGLGNSPNLELFVPRDLLLQGYNYHAPIAWGQTFVRPNGFFFLEPSFASAFIGSALIIEMTFFRRPLRIMLYGAALLGTVAATGIVLMLVAAPFLLARQNLRTAALTVVVGLIGLGAAILSGAADQFIGRLSELSTPGSSGFSRLIQPIIQLGGVYVDVEAVLKGVGAGNSVERDVSLWPLAKVAIEYGAMAGALFIVLIIVCMSGSRNRALAAALFVVFNFTGGFLLLPVTVIQIMFLVCLLPPAPRERAREVFPRLARAPSRSAHRAAGVVVPLRPEHAGG